MSNNSKLTLILCSILIILICNVCFASPIAETWLHATVLIENEWGSTGTGFLVTRYLSNKESKIFLCTNKHVLNKKEALRSKATSIIFHLNIKDVDGKITGKKYTVNLIDAKGKKIWKEHQDKNVDVLVFDLTPLFIMFPEIANKTGMYKLFADDKVLSGEEITIGDDIMIIGYPLGFKQGETNFPIVRQGIIASQIGQRFVTEVADKNNKIVKKAYRGFLIDGGVIPGSSGSPVILKPVSGRKVGSTIKMAMAKPYLLGIISETRFAPIKTNKGTIPSYAGLGIAYDASTVKETIELFFSN